MRIPPYLALSLCLLASLLTGVGCQSTPQVVEKPREYSFWPPAPDEPHIQFLTAYNSSADVVPPQTHFDVMMYGREHILDITKPYGVGMWQGKIYVCDVRSRGITVLDLRGHIAKAVGVGGSTEIVKAVDIAIAPDGMKYVVDGASHAIVAVDPDDHPVARFAPKDFSPVSVAVYGDELFVADFNAKIIKVLNRADGRPLRTIGEAGGEEGQFTGPLAVRVDPSGVVFVDDVVRCRVLRFTRDGKYLSVFGQPGNLPGDFARPKHFAFDKDGDLYIVDSAFANVQVFDDQQKIVGYFGSPGPHPGAMNLPAGICVDQSPEDLAIFQEYVHPAFQAEKLLLVTNQFGLQRVSVYAVGHLKPGKTVADVSASRSKVATGIATPSTQPDSTPPTPSAQPPAPAKGEK